MNDKSIFSLSDYQRATLTEMGIPFWQLVTRSIDSYESDDGANKDEINSLPRANKKMDLQESEPVVAQEKKQKISIPQNILLLMPEAQSAHPLINDVLNTLNLPLNPAITVSESNEEEYVGHLLTWKVAAEMVLHGSVLSTPDLTQLSSPEAKKQLWRLLQKWHQFL